MIALEHVSKSCRTERGLQKIIDDACCIFKPGQNVAILGEDAMAKSVLINLLSGKIKPSAGRIRRRGRIFTGVNRLQTALTGVENAKFACRIYGMDIRAVMAYISRFTNLGNALNEPITSYSQEMRTRFATGLCLGLRFDVYVVDALGSAMDARFLKQAAAEFAPGPDKRDLILLSGSRKTIRQHCSHGITLHQGKLGEIRPLDEALIELQSLS